MFSEEFFGVFQIYRVVVFEAPQLFGTCVKYEIGWIGTIMRNLKLTKKSKFRKSNNFLIIS